MKVLKPEFAIIGAGVAGVPLAIALRQAGREVLLLEKDLSPPVRLKGEYMQPLAAQILSDLGMRETVEEFGPNIITQLRFRDFSRNMESPRLSVEIDYPDAVGARVFSNQSMMKSLWRAAEARIGDSFLRGVRITPVQTDPKEFVRKPSLQVTHGEETFRVEPRYLIGCDGLHSQTRTWAGGEKFRPDTGPVTGARTQLIIGCELESTLARPNTQEMFRTRDGSFSLFDIGGGRIRLYACLPPSVDETPGSSGKARWEAPVQRFLTSYAERIGLAPFKILSTAGAPAGSKFMGAPAHGAVFLAGDALACTTPFGGQGMTCATTHVQNLVELLSARGAMPDQVHAEYLRRAREFYDRIQIINTAQYYLFYSNANWARTASIPVLANWAKSPEIREKVALLFGGMDPSTPGPADILRILGQLPMRLHWPWRKPTVLPRRPSIHEDKKLFNASSGKH